ncbi:MAG: hypothetical protein EOO88_25925 [Pedobacter sp.]|nr:MAG: hypothetical protein EOO88_25925 [Pedobacter sp.]
MLQHLKDQFAAYPADFYSHFFLLLPVFIAIYRREFLTPVLWAITLYFTVQFVEECVLLYYALLVKYNHNVTKGTLVLDILLVGAIYFLSFTTNKFSQKIVLVATSLAACTALVNYLSAGPPSISRAIFCLLLIILSLTYFNRILAENRIRKIVNHSLFWVSAGFLFYGMGTFMTSVFSDYLVVMPKETYDLFSDMGQWVSIILSVLASVGLWVSKYDKDNYIQPI